MANQAISFVIPGIPIETISEPEIAGLLNVRAASSHAIVPARRGEARAAARVDTAPDSIVKIEYSTPTARPAIADPRPASTARAAFRFYSKREYMNELRNISAPAKGASSQEAEELRGRAAELDRGCPSTMRDGELLFALGEAYKALKDFPSAIDAYRNAIAVPRASAPIEALEQLANVLDRGARNEEAAKASQLWAEAEKLLSILNAAIGPSGERLSLLGAISKRRGEKEQDKEKRGGHYRRAAELYREAYTFRRAKENLIDTSSGINWLMLEYSLGNPYEPLREAAEEILAYARLPKNSPDFWARVALPDALTVEYLFA